MHPGTTLAQELAPCSCCTGEVGCLVLISCHGANRLQDGCQRYLIRAATAFDADQFLHLPNGGALLLAPAQDAG